MTRLEQEEFIRNFHAQKINILLKKGNDYSNTDRLSNFKLGGNICGMSGELSCLNLIATKVARLGVLLNSKLPPTNESVLDSVLDLSNYADLLACLIEDSRKNAQTQV